LPRSFVDGFSGFAIEPERQCAAAPQARLCKLIQRGKVAMDCVVSVGQISAIRRR
jgi:hypothetical protein